MKSIVTFILFAIVSITVSANDGTKSLKSNEKAALNLTGYIVDETTGESLTGVTVKLNDKTVFTDFDGKFSFENVSAGKVILEVTYVAYENEKVEIETNQQEEIKITLKEE